MTIDASKIRGQLESLDVQEQQLVGQLHEVRGAQRLCRHWLGQIERADDEAKKKKAEEAAAAGEKAGDAEVPAAV